MSTEKQLQYRISQAKTANKLFTLWTTYDLVDCCFLFKSCPLADGHWYIGVGRLVDGTAYHLYDVMFTDGSITALRHPYGTPVWELPHDRIAELPKAYQGAGALLPFPLYILSQLDKCLLPVHDESVLYPYRVLSCLSPESSAVAEFFRQRKAFALAGPAGRMDIRLRLDELQDDMEQACAHLRLSLPRLKKLYRALCRWSRRHNGACFPAEAHKDVICSYLMEGRYE